MHVPRKFCLLVWTEAIEDWQRCQEKNVSATIFPATPERSSRHKDLAHKCLFSGCYIICRLEIPLPANESVNIARKDLGIGAGILQHY